MNFIDELKTILHGHDFRSVELEFRVGFQTSTGFQSSIPKIAWINAKNKLSGGVDTITIDKYIKSRPNESYRHVTTPTDSYMEHKQKIANKLFPTDGSYSVRCSLAQECRKETVKPPNSYVMQRKKYRTSYTRGSWRIDFTRVEIIPVQNDIEEVYEIEVELADLGYFFEKELELIIEEGRNIASDIVGIK